MVAPVILQRVADPTPRAVEEAVGDEVAQPPLGLRLETAEQSLQASLTLAVREQDARPEKLQDER
jgi:hypothetical protein